jgi:P-type Mg2+ transporter
MQSDDTLLSKSLTQLATCNNQEIFRALQTNESGLSSTTAYQRLEQYGQNIFREKIKLHVFLQYLSIFKSPILIMLLCISVVSFILGQTLDASIVMLMVFLSATLNFFQEYKAGRAAEKLEDQVATRTQVIRDGKKIDIFSRDVTLGDILDLNAGDLIPADARVISARDFFVNQSILTGESFPVEKTSDPVPEGTENLIDLANIVFAGTSVITGTAQAIVTHTGDRTQFGKIAQDLAKAPEDNEFTRGVQQFGFLIMRVIFFLVLFIFLINSILKHDPLESLTFSLAVAVGLAPEFLPMIMSVTMSRGSVKMAKKDVIVKKLTAIPAFGSMDVLCTDKTGTLTDAKIKLVKYVDIEGIHSESVLLNAYLNSTFQTGISNPMDDAVLSYKKIDVAEYEKIDEIPYDFIRKKMSVVVEHKNKRQIITKGAPEEVFKSCNFYHKNGKLAKLDENAKKTYQKIFNQLSQDGFRVLAIGIKSIENGRHIYTKHDEINLELVGFVAFLDPAKDSAKEAIERLEKMGVEIKVVTGDNELVTQKICHDLEIKVKGMLLGHEIIEMTDDVLRHKVERTTIFARCAPQEKKRVIQMLKLNRHVVGYLGDGINDASSIQEADVGISVNNAVDVAKETADIILTHKSLHELADGVVEGRKTFGNTMKYILMGLSSNFGNMFSVIGAVIFLPFLPMLPIQILLNNFLYDFSQLSIPTDNVDESYIEKPKRWNIKFIRNFMFIFGPISSVFDFTSYALLYFLYRNNPSSFQTGWFMESLATQTLVIHIIRTRFIPVKQSNASVLLWLTTLLAVVIGWVIPYTPVGRLFSFSPLAPSTVIMLIFIVLIYLLCAEIGKRLYYRKYYRY